jgi:hypothetical protein
MEQISIIGTAVLGDINNVISGTARIEKPNPVNPCKAAEKRKINNPIITI